VRHDFVTLVRLANQALASDGPALPQWRDSLIRSLQAALEGSAVKEKKAQKKGVDE